VKQRETVLGLFQPHWHIFNMRINMIMRLKQT